MLTDLDLMRLHVEAEFTRDSVGDLLATNERAARPAPRFFFGHTTLGLVVRYRHDVSAARRHELQTALTQLARSPSMMQPDVPLDPTSFERILAAEAPIEHTSVGMAYRFPNSLPVTGSTRILRDASDAAMLHPLLAAWAPDILCSSPLAVSVVDGQAVAVCGSVRITARAHEGGVETAAPFRARGHGRAAVAAWAGAVRALGAEPLYSTVWQNDASRALARALGLVPIGRDLHIR